MLQSFDDNVQMQLSGFPEPVIKEFAVEPPTGIGSVSRRGLARLSGVSHQTWGQGGSIFAKKVDEYLAQHGFEGGSIFDKEGRILDIVAALVIKYYAYQGNEVAQRTDSALGAIGLRTVIQKSLGWEAPHRLTEKEIVSLLVMPVAAPYSPKFEVEFYNHLSRLTGLKANGNLRPNYWAALTKELVYDYMPTGVYEEIKRWQRSTEVDKKTKVHQYMSEHGLEVLMFHLKRLLTLMSGASSLDELRQSLQQSVSNRYQLNLFNAPKTKQSHQ